MTIGKLIGQGRTAEVFNYDNDKIVKLFRKEMPKNAVEAEYNISLELNSMGLPVPKVFDLIEHEDRLGIIYEKVDGIPMLKMISLKPWKITEEAKRFAELHKEIQRDIKFQNPRQRTRLKENIAATDLLEESIKSKLYTYLDRLPDDNILCHGDFHPDNILISNKKAVVIDWMTAAVGNPLADVARTSVIFKFAIVPEDKSFIEKKLINFMRDKFYSEYIRHYIHISNFSIEEIEKWELPVAAARLIEWLPKEEKELLVNFIMWKIGEL